MASNFGANSRACPECRFANGSCRQFVIGHPNPVCVAGYPQRVVEDVPGLDLLVPAPRRSPENLRVR
jgi:hypothetical protein